MKDKETETLPEWALNAAMELYPNGHPNVAYCWDDPEKNERAKQKHRDELAAVFVKHWNTRPATLDDRALDLLERLATETQGLRLRYKRQDETTPPLIEELARALLREAGRVK